MISYKEKQMLRMPWHQTNSVDSSPVSLEEYIAIIHKLCLRPEIPSISLEQRL